LSRWLSKLLWNRFWERTLGHIALFRAWCKVPLIILACQPLYYCPCCFLLDSLLMYNSFIYVSYQTDSLWQLISTSLWYHQTIFLMIFKWHWLPASPASFLTDHLSWIHRCAIQFEIFAFSDYLWCTIFLLNSEFCWYLGWNITGWAISPSLLKIYLTMHFQFAQSYSNHNLFVITKLYSYQQKS